MKILIACESSGVVRRVFAAKGHDVTSCDLEPAADNSPNHRQCDVRELLSMEWDMIIAHPPCTYLCSSGLHWNRRIPGREELTAQALEFARLFLEHPCPRICVENPVGRIGTAVRPADQYIQPYEFGEDASKRTGLWLKGLPKLVPTRRHHGRMVNWKGVLVERWANQTDSGQNRLAPSVKRWQERSKTYQGIADAMANQWG